MDYLIFGDFVRELAILPESFQLVSTLKALTVSSFMVIMLHFFSQRGGGGKQHISIFKRTSKLAKERKD